MNERAGDRFADADPEYIRDAADDVELDLAELEPDDPTKIPKDEGDFSTAEARAARGDVG
jgi:hypothetical protein